MDWNRPDGVGESVSLAVQMACWRMEQVRPSGVFTYAGSVWAAGGLGRLTSR
ncbi:hypothetical protein BTZ20_0790 [Rhodococcus sp. MTM3W5.2]|nr:hypothetical protein BTZ20_0790 [Rhodococcus sp. MTM3W5.2]